jgi:hypothetical protein
MRRIYRHALRGLPETMDGAPPLPIPAEMSTPHELLAEPDHAARHAGALRRSYRTFTPRFPKPPARPFSGMAASHHPERSSDRPAGINP